MGMVDQIVGVDMDVADVKMEMGITVVVGVAVDVEGATPPVKPPQIEEVALYVAPMIT